MQSILPPSAGLCGNQVQSYAAIQCSECCHLRRSPKGVQSFIHAGGRTVRLGQCPVRVRESKVRFADIHVVICQVKARVSRARSGERANQQFRMFYAQQCASRHRFLRSAEPDIHLQSRAPKSLHRRLSLYSLPVPKQFVESLGSVISFAQSATCRTWQSAHFVHPIDFGSIYAAVVLRSSAGTKSLCCRSTASKYATIFRATASVARLLFPFCVSWS
jgi:hypothetical protein